ncbi:MAG: hypothetical protein RL757_2675 [Bacteroidota bacterium]|jgi:hypothetical protein
MTTKKSLTQTYFSLLFLAIVLLFSNCKNGEPTNTKLSFSRKTIEKKLEDDGTRNEMTAEAKLAFPLAEGNPALRDSMLLFAENFAVNRLLSSAPTAGMNVDLAITQFFNRFIESYKDAEDGYFKSWSVETHDSILGNSVRAVSLRMTAEMYAEGSQDDHLIAIANFNPSTGTRIDIKKLITDAAGLQQLCEKKYREIEADAFKQGYQIEEFKLPENIGIVEKGLIFHYNMYEVGNRTVGDTEFFIPYSELKNYINFEPVSKAAP